MITRQSYLDQINTNCDIFPIVALLGPRQCGKTTLAKEYAASYAGPVHLFDLENPQDWQLMQNPQLLLSDLEGLIVIDEVQRVPELFKFLRFLVDQPGKKQRFLILGSASRDLIQQSSESLAGRIGYISINPFSVFEVADLKTLHQRGGFPRSYLAKNDAAASLWLENYIQTFLEQDIPQLGINIPAQTLWRFWNTLTHYHGNIYNSSEIGRSLGVSDHTARHYLDILVGTFMVRQLTPWFENIEKRQVKRPKIYIRDSGIFHKLLGVSDFSALFRHPKIGASWEGFALEQIIQLYRARPEECYFWSIHQQGELDLLIFKDGQRHGFEFKYSDAPTLTKSMLMAQETLNLDTLHVIYPGDKTYKLTDDITVCSLANFMKTRS